MSLFTAQLYPGRALGFLALGASLHDVLTRIKAEPQRFPKIEVLYSPRQPVSEPVCIVLPPNGLRLRFDGPEQRLRLIEVVDFTKSHITFKDRDLLKPGGDSGLGPTFRHIYHRLLGPTYAGEFIPSTSGSGDEREAGIYVLSYPGVAFNFPLAKSHYSPERDVVALLSASSSSQVADSMAVFNGDSWAEARAALWTAPLPSVRLPPVAGRVKDSFPDEVSLVRIYGGGRVGMFRKWTADAFRLQLGQTTPQELVAQLGPPSAIYRKSDQKMVIHKMRLGSGSDGGNEPGRTDDLTDTDLSSINTCSDGPDKNEAIDDETAASPSGECFYNYFYLGFDVLLSTPTTPSPQPPGVADAGGTLGVRTHQPDRLVATKLVLHGNIPGSYEFNRHRRCRWDIDYLPAVVVGDGNGNVDSDNTGRIGSETAFAQIEEHMSKRWRQTEAAVVAPARQHGMVLNRGWGDSPGSSCEMLGGWEGEVVVEEKERNGRGRERTGGGTRLAAGGGGGGGKAGAGESTTTLYGFPGLVFEVLKNDFVNTVTVF